MKLQSRLKSRLRPGLAVPHRSSWSCGVGWGAAGGGRRAAARGEIAASEQIGGGDHSSAHGAVFVSALRPGEIAFQPEIEAHWLYFTTVRDCTASTSSPLEKGLRSARADGKRAMSDGSGMAAR